MPTSYSRKRLENRAHFKHVDAKSWRFLGCFCQRPKSDRAYPALTNFFPWAESRPCQLAKEERAKGETITYKFRRNCNEAFVDFGHRLDFEAVERACNMHWSSRRLRLC